MCDSWCCRHHKTPKLVCFKHRFVAKVHERRPWHDSTFKSYGHCPTCRAPLVNVGSGAKIPPKRNAVAWRKFETWHNSRKEEK